MPRISAERLAQLGCGAPLPDLPAPEPRRSRAGALAGGVYGAVSVGVILFLVVMFGIVGFSLLTVARVFCCIAGGGCG